MNQRVSREEASDYYQPAYSLIERGKREGIFKDIPNNLFVAFIYAPMALLVRQHLRGDIVLDSELRQMIYETTWDALTV